MKSISRFMAVLGVVLAAYAVVGRFVGPPTVLGRVIPGGMHASNLLIVANTCLLLAVVLYLYASDCCKRDNPDQKN